MQLVKGKHTVQVTGFIGMVLEQHRLYAHNELVTCRWTLVFPDESLLSILVLVLTASLQACLAITQHVISEKRTYSNCKEWL